MNYNYSITVDTESTTGEIRAVYFQVRSGKSASVKEFQRGDVLADYDKEGNLLGIEVLAPCRISLLEKILRDEPHTRQFVKRSIPRKMVSAS
jgi:uncharacterized protein YuzE